MSPTAEICREHGLLAVGLGRAVCRAHLVAAVLLLALCVFLSLWPSTPAVGSTPAVVLLACIVGLLWHLVES